MKEITGSKNVSSIFVMVVFCIFAASMLTALILSAGIYKSMTDISRDRQNERTIFSYISTKVKSSDEAGMIHVGDFDGVSAIFFDEIIDDTLYRTAIYLYDGWVRELLSNPEAGLTPQDGMRLMELDDLSFHYLGSSKRLIIVGTGNQGLVLYPRAQEPYISDIHTKVS